MNFPGKKKLRHWFWVLAFRYPRLRIWLTRLLIREEEKDIQIFGSPLHINTRHEIGLSRAAAMADENVIFRDEAASLLNLALLLEPGDVFVDIGANVGLYSSVLSRFRQAFPAMQFVAIEANPATAARLQKSIEGRGVTMMNVGASNRATDLGFEEGVTSGVFKVSENGPVRIHCDRLDALALPAGDLVLKIDVENHELPVLEGASELFAAGRIKVVYLDGFSGDAIPPLLRRYGFVFFDGRTFARCQSDAVPQSLLAVHESRLQRDASG